MATNRTIDLPAIWASTGVDVTPEVPPTPLTTYVNSGMTNDEIAAGWAYKKTPGAEGFNEVFKRVTALIQSMAQYGFLPWCATTNYKKSGCCVGSDDVIYQALVDNVNVNPTGSIVYWRPLMGIRSSNIVQYTDTEVLTAADFGKSIFYNASSPGQLTLPSITACPVGSIISIANINSGACTVARAGSALIYALGQSGVTSLVLHNGDSVQLVTGGVNWGQVMGNDVNLSKFVNSVSGSHWTTVLPDGTVMKRGHINDASTGASLQLVFPVAFPTAIQSLILTAWAVQGDNGNYNHANEDATGATVYKKGSSTSYTYDYIAFGN